MQLKKLVARVAAVGITRPGLAFATNGMLMEGYGPIASGMGGTAMAYDNGTAAMANNPATLGLMVAGSRIDVMLGFVGPDVSAPGTMGKSRADAFYMPAFGYVKKQGDLTYGAGLYGQGGMGTENANGDMAQVSVGRLIFSLVYRVNDRLNIGGSVDFVWAGMDLVAGMAGINFKDSSNFTGAAKGYSQASQAGLYVQTGQGCHAWCGVSNCGQPAQPQGRWLHRARIRHAAGGGPGPGLAGKRSPDACCRHQGRVVEQQHEYRHHRVAHRRCCAFPAGLE